MQAQMQHTLRQLLGVHVLLTLPVVYIVAVMAAQRPSVAT